LKTIFVVDDQDLNLVKAKRALENYYRVLTLPSAVKMLSMINKIKPDLILLDIKMPEMDGFEALNLLKERDDTREIPVMFLTANTDDEIEAKGLEFGAVDFVTKPFSPPVLLNRIAHHLHIDDLLRKRTERLEHMQNQVLSVIVDTVESRDKVTGGHIERTSQYIRILINAMLERDVYGGQIGKWNIESVVSSSRLHDVGKIVVSDIILNKPGRLNAEEYEEIKKHALEGELTIDRIIAKTWEADFLIHAKVFAGSHHERWDGNGYPRGLKGLNIPLEGRIMAIADVYDALISERPYKKPFTRAEAEAIIRKDAGTFFDPAIVDIFNETAGEFAAASDDAEHIRHLS
jgi:putative two-component system response regulator